MFILKELNKLLRDLAGGGKINSQKSVLTFSGIIVAGAICSRKINNEATPSISLAVVPKYRFQGIARTMLEQFLAEAGALYDSVQVDLIKESTLDALYKKFGFEVIEHEGKSLVDGKKTIKLLRKL